MGGRFKKKKPKIIYRTGSGNGTNLTPRDRDTGGLSYSTKVPSERPYTATTMEAINTTGELIAVKDGKIHVSVKPVKSSKMSEWVGTRDNANNNPHKYTKILQGLSVKVK